MIQVEGLDPLPGDDPEASSSGEGYDSDGDDDGGEPPGEPLPVGCADLEPIVTTVLADHCSGCHSGADAPAGFDYVEDIVQLVQAGRIVPGDAEGSPLYRRMADEQMPPAGVDPRPSEDQIAAVAEWIDGCVPQTACTHEDFITTEQVLDRMRSDIGDTSQIPSDERRFHRYFTLTELYNAGNCSEDLDVFRWGLSKTVNSLSSETQIVAPVAIDADELIYRIDLRDYGWDAALWDDIIDRNPFAIEYVRDEALDLKAFTETAVPFVAASWFVSAASRPPLYHEILEIPGNRAQLEQQFAINVQANIDDDEVVRSGFSNSGVSVNNRLIERHEFPGASNRTYWLSYDFASNGGNSNIFAVPLDFQAQGNEVIFNLPNGLFGFMITDQNGNRIDQAPDNIVTDPAQPDQNVVNGLSCMGCHAHGVIPRADEVRSHVLESFAFDDATKQKVIKLHPVEEDLFALQQLDTDRFLDALAQTGTPTNLEDEPVNFVFQDFDLDVDPRRAAAELGITEQELTNQLGGLGPDLETLLTAPVKREVFRLNFARSVCDLNIGLASVCGGPGEQP